MRAFFTLAAVSTNMQRTFRAVVMAHLVMLLILVLGMLWKPDTNSPVLFGLCVLVAGIIEGALLIGWRLTQIPKSQALEFLLVSSTRPPAVLLAEALVGITRLALVTFSGLPILMLMIESGMIRVEDVPVLLAMPLVFGALTGLALATWAYEPDGIRRWAEKLAILGVLVYLIVGVLAGERLGDWLSGLPFGWGANTVAGLRMLHDYNPFGAMQFAMEQSPTWTWPRVAWVLSLGMGSALVLLFRCSLRLHGHFHDLHYRPLLNQKKVNRPPVGDDPLTWWAVKRVTRYSGRINVWLAGGFGLLYAAYTIAGDHWPIWMGRAVFEIFDRVGGLPMLATVLMLLATVPAAFQYGLWDASAQDRSRRLELLLLTELDGAAYWQAALAAAWRRSREYFVLAVLLWMAAAVADRITWLQALAGISAGIILWSLYFAIGFRAFSRGTQANQLGVALTLLLPMATGMLAQTELRSFAMLLPPGSVYFGSTESPNGWWMLGPLLAGGLAIWLTRAALVGCDAQLRRWYAEHHVI